MNTKIKQPSLPIQMLGGLVLGVACAVFFPGFSAKLGFLTSMFGHAIKMVVMPLIFLSVTVGVFRAGRLRERLGTVAISSIGFFLLMTVLAAALGLLLNFAFRPGLGADNAHSGSMPAALASSIDWTKFLVDLIPANIVAALSAGNSLPVLVFGVILGAALAATADRAEPAIAVFEALLSGLFKMTEWVIAWSPLAIFAASAQLLSTKGFSGARSLIALLGVAYLGMAVLAILLTLVIRIAGQSPVAVLRKVREPLILGFTTRSSEITFPLHLKKLVEMGVPHGVASTILPLAYIFNRDGAVLYTALAVGYLADAYHLVWTWPLAITIVLLTIITIDGAANVPSGAIVAITIVLTSIGLPADAVLLLLGVDAFFDMGRTALNVYGSTAAAAVAVKLAGPAGLAAEPVREQANA
ncbi:dicarboxylate/amino acid:cation symporter [Burkholderia sp. JP2-270]|uniref:dicarboxylate/amino acid:cation symporter n=1 Tax=Burkholderia sp. JP2-270 TaxID=2217913 RepID=UPI000DA30317|nr:dicarboxylate/amino acid:cation symporter [Burkholderia sp. JP2-270]AWV05244.1 dicarboxylate/amino acid:cation symporter [Burkholderia sp. JP2-270]